MSSSSNSTSADSDVKMTTETENKETKEVKEPKVKPVVTYPIKISEEDDGTPIALNTKDGKTITVSQRRFAYPSELVRAALENDSNAKELDVKGVESTILAYIVSYWEHHQGEPKPAPEKPLRSKIMKEVCKDAFDAELVDKVWLQDKQQLYDLVLAANYLGANELLHIACAKVASVIKGQPIDKLKEILDPKVPTVATEEKKEEKKE